MAKVQVTVRGMREVGAMLDKYKARYLRAVTAGVYGFAEEIMTDAKRRTPVDEGTLKGSGYVALPKRRGGKFRVDMGFGGPADRYAIAQHEHTEYRHEVGEAKYLENAVNAAVSQGANRIFEIATAAFNASQGPRPGSNPETPTEQQQGGGKKGNG